MAHRQGLPCWYELCTAQGDLDDAQKFYEALLGWTVQGAGMEGMDYRLASSDGAMVAGLMEGPAPAHGTQPGWLMYFTVDDADDTARRIGQAGGKVHAGPSDIPGTGRFAIATDPQGGRFGILQPLPMEKEQPPAFDQQKAGHGNWIELMSSDPEAGFGFYAGLFGWGKGQAMDMGAMGTYQLISHGGGDIGGVMGLGNAPFTCWLPYFGVNGIDAAAQRIRAGGGQVHRGPSEVPGGAFIVAATDPHGAWFCLVGPRERAG